MKNTWKTVFTMLVAGIAVILMLIEVVNLIHMMGIHFTEEGFSVVWKEDAPWQFISTMRSWWYWILGILSGLLFCFGWEKKETDSE